VLVAMFYSVNFIRQTLREMRKRKLRAFLAIFSIAWGILTVALLLAVGSGFHAASKKNILNVTENVFSVMPGETSKAYRGQPPGQTIHVRTSDLINLDKIIPGVKEVTPLFTISNANLVYKNKQLKKNIFGIGPSFTRMRKVKIELPGRFFNYLDLQNNSRIAVLGHKLKTELFANDDALGKRILINNVAFTVVGVIQQFTKNVYNWYDNALLIPYTTYLAINGDRDVNVVAVSPDAQVDAAIVERDMRNYFAYKFNFDPTDETAVKIYSAAKIMQFFFWFFLVIQIFLGLCGILTLGAASIGIANLMFLSVAERTREIGIRKALGANHRHILMQILLEALVVVVSGGILGLGITYLIILILQYVPLPEWLGTPTISWLSLGGILGVLAFFGIAAGYFPAQRAANLDPVKAIKN